MGVHTELAQGYIWGCTRGYIWGYTRGYTRMYTGDTRGGMMREYA